jgi:hypothetical protein
MATLRLRRQPSGPAAESVDEMAQLKQIGKTAERAKGGVVVWQSSRSVGATLAPIGPPGRNERGLWCK